VYCNDLYLHSFPTRRSSDLLISADRLAIYYNLLIELDPSELILEEEENKNEFIFDPNRRELGAFFTLSKFCIFLTHMALLSFDRSEEHTSELQSRENLVCRL